MPVVFKKTLLVHPYLQCMPWFALSSCRTSKLDLLMDEAKTKDVLQEFLLLSIL